MGQIWRGHCLALSKAMMQMGANFLIMLMLVHLTHPHIHILLHTLAHMTYPHTQTHLHTLSKTKDNLKLLILQKILQKEEENSRLKHLR